MNIDLTKNELENLYYGFKFSLEGLTPTETDKKLLKKLEKLLDKQ
jgi:hypothetical protein